MFLPRPSLPFPRHRLASHVHVHTSTSSGACAPLSPTTSRANGWWNPRGLPPWEIDSLFEPTCGCLGWRSQGWSNARGWDVGGCDRRWVPTGGWETIVGETDPPPHNPTNARTTSGEVVDTRILTQRRDGSGNPRRHGPTRNEDGRTRTRTIRQNNNTITIEPWRRESRCKTQETSAR